MHPLKYIILGLLAACGLQARQVAIQSLDQRLQGGIVYELGKNTYLANDKHPRSWLKLTEEKHPHLVSATPFAITVIVVNQSVITEDCLNTIITSYIAKDDVFIREFLSAIYLTASHPSPTIEPSAVQFLLNSGAKAVLVDSDVLNRDLDALVPIKLTSGKPLPPGPYTGMVGNGTIHIYDTYRLYTDEYQSFVTGTYPSNDGTGSFTAVDRMSSRLRAPMIPVPSRIHTWGDSRPLAGQRIAVKDLYDMKGVQTSAGSKAWVHVTPIANSTAVAIQRLVDLGAVPIGKLKMAQFASGANPWDWTDVQHPFNPRGDGYLTCAVSSSGGGCSLAAYDWIDAAIGSDTGVSMRRPAAVSGVFGNRPSQGMVSLEGMIPQAWAQDTAGVFGRDPVKWARFAKAWYTAELYQNESISGLAPLSVPDTMAFPSQILYPDEYFPLLNPAAQAILDSTLTKMTKTFNMTIKHTNFSATVMNSNIYSDTKDNWERIMMSSATLIVWTNYVAVAEPLISTWAKQNDGRFPPVDPQWRSEWVQFNGSVTNQSAYNEALRNKRISVDWFEENILTETANSCSESVMICDVGTQGLSSYREKALNEGPNATFLGYLPAGAATSCGAICAVFGCVDFTIPLGQVPYKSPVTKVTEQLPVSINMIVRRGCDFVMFNFIEKMAEAGIVRTVKTGKTAF
ncbi:amidase family protein [Aspergillus avenaceus]|uniref:Amidase family protein n=1 Tax=Aspergillus avenaceus TaxID=36643 RepID=A0A5N6U6C2_ASPAV|nr:amidase family protein [Aspergillus avenaceus]